MRKARIAEWILSLVTTSERAASAVGDLMEDVAGRGALRFWASVSHLAISLLFRDLAANPVRMAGLGALGLLIEVLLIAAVGLSIGILVFAAMLALWGLGLDEPQQLASWLSTAPSTQPGGLVVYAVMSWALVVLVQFQVGRVLARKSPGRELAPCVAMTILGLALGPVLERVSGGRLPMDYSILNFTIYQIPFLVSLLAGAAMVRRGQRLRT
jgi:hypothetical protein